MNKSVEDLKKMLLELGCDERILKNPSFSNFPVLRDAIILFVNDSGIYIKREGDKIELKRFIEDDGFIIKKSGNELLVTYNNSKNPNLKFYSEIQCNEDENIIVRENHDNESELVHEFNANGLEVELVRKSKKGLILNGIRRCNNGYVGEIWSSKLNENKTSRVDTIMGCVDLDLRTPSLKFGAGYTPDMYDEVYNSLAMNRVSYVSSETAQYFVDEICGVSWPIETKEDLIKRIGNKDDNNILINEKYNEKNYEYRRVYEEESASKVM